MYDHGLMKNSKKQVLRLTLLASCLISIQHAYALQALEDTDLRAVDGQDGINIGLNYSQVDIEQAYWEDQAGSSSGTASGAAGVAKKLRATATDIKIRDTINAVSKLGSNLQVNTGSNAAGTKAGLDFKLTSSPSTITVNSFKICDTVAVPVCGGEFGRLAIETTSDLTLGLSTQEGLFNNTSLSSLNIGLNNANVYIGHDFQGNTALNNQLILKNLNFNFVGKGTMFVTEGGGLRLQTNVGDMTTVLAGATQVPDATYGYIDFTRVEDSDTSLNSNGTFKNSAGKATNSGLNIEIMTKGGASYNAANPAYSLAGSKGLIRLGANGRIVNGFLQVRGVDGSATSSPTVGAGYAANNTNILGSATTAVNQTPTGGNASVMGSSGIAVRMRGEFTKEGDTMLGLDGKATTLEIGGAGLNSIGFEFGNLSPLVSNSTKRAYFDSGNVYFNLADTKNLLLPENAVFKGSRFGGTAGNFLTSITDYNQVIHTGTLNTNPYSLVMAIRGAEFQALSKRGRFTSSANIANPDNIFAPTAGINNKWGLGLPIYNLNANLAMYGTTSPANTPVYTLDGSGNVAKTLVSGTQRLGLSLAMSTEGKSSDGSKTTSIMVIDGGDNPNNANKPNDYYIGLRNIDMLLKGTGSVGFENGNFNVNLPDLLVVMAAELASGYLPGAKAKTMGSTYVSPIDNFNLPNDVLLGIKLRLRGAIDFALVPNSDLAGVGGGSLSVIGDFTMAPSITGNTIQISDPIDDSIIGLDNIVGKVRFNNSIGLSKNSPTAPINPNAGKVGFNYAFTFNPDKNKDGVFRVRDINLYPKSQAGQRLGEMAITGGTLSTSMMITPRN